MSPISYLWHIQQGLAGKTSILSYRAIEWPFFPPHKPTGQLKSYISSGKLFGQRFRLHCLVFCIKCLYILKDGDTLQKVEKLDELMIALMKEIRKQHFYWFSQKDKRMTLMFFFRCASIFWFQVVSQSVIHAFRLAHLRVFQSYFISSSFYFYFLQDKP